MPTLHEVVRAICLALPEVEEVRSHGSPDYRVRKKSFATFTVNHHGDGKLALLLNAAPETQALYVRSDPKTFFVPPYVGTRGWYGIDLARGLSWKRVAELACDAYRRVAPATLAGAALPLGKVSRPDTVDLRRIDPLFFPATQKRIEQVRALCMALPEVSEDVSFGNPVWRAGKKTFCQFVCYDAMPGVLVWVGAEGQAALTSDARFDVPAYFGHNGWIRLRVDKRFDVPEVAALIGASYRHFAIERMRRALDAGPDAAPVPVTKPKRSHPARTRRPASKRAR